MAEEFSSSVEDGLRLSARLYSEKERGGIAIAPKPMVSMEKSGGKHFLPESPMVYAVIKDPSIVDNPDIPSYQPYVYGRLDPPALIPLLMKSVELQVDTYLDTATVHLDGCWRLHCVMGSKSCDCRLAIPMGLHGSILGVEVGIGKKNYYTELISPDTQKDPAEPVVKGRIIPNIFMLTIPKVAGGSNISIKLSWVQKILFNDGEFSLTVPFSFPEYVTPAVKKIPKREKIALNVNLGSEMKISCNSTSHPFKESKREGKVSYLYDAEIHNWSNTDLVFSYTVFSTSIYGGVQMQSASVSGSNEWTNFCFYLFPGDRSNTMACRRTIVYVVDISKSMNGKPLEATKRVLSEAINDLESNDSFNIITFNDYTSVFSSSMVPADTKNIGRAVEWMNTAFVATGGTAMLQPLSQAMQMVSNTRGSVPTIFFITDGTVENEKQICEVFKSHATRAGTMKPRIYTFGIGLFCNHYFLQMLAMISGGQYEAAYDIDLIESRMQKLLQTVMSTTLVNISIDTFDHSDAVEIFPSHIPDLTTQTPLLVSGRIRGKIPETVRVTGVLADQTEFIHELKPQFVEDASINLVLAKQQLDCLTAQAWLSGSKEIEERVINLSLEAGIPTEYTPMALMESDQVNQKTSEHLTKSQVTSKTIFKKTNTLKVDVQAPRRLYVQSLGVGFGNLVATEENLQPGCEPPKVPEAAEILIRATSNCCDKVCNKCCCMCCIACCAKMNNETATVLTQCCMALTWLGCFECCSALCCGGNK